MQHGTRRVLRALRLDAASTSRWLSEAITQEARAWRSLEGSARSLPRSFSVSLSLSDLSLAFPICKRGAMLTSTS